MQTLKAQVAEQEKALEVSRRAFFRVFLRSSVNNILVPSLNVRRGRQRNKVIIVGNIGSGKTTLFSALKKRYGLTTNFVDERVDKLTNYRGKDLLEILYTGSEPLVAGVDTLMLKMYLETERNQDFGTPVLYDRDVNQTALFAAQR